MRGVFGRSDDCIERRTESIDSYQDVADRLELPPPRTPETSVPVVRLHPFDRLRVKREHPAGHIEEDEAFSG